MEEMKRCKKCGSFYKPAKGWAKLKNLTKWELSDLWWLAFILFLLFAVYMYKQDIEKCRAVIEDPCLHCDYRRKADQEANQTFFGPTLEEVEEALRRINISTEGFDDNG